MKYQKWHIGTASEQDTALLKEAGYPSLLATVLAARGITTSEAAAEALERETGCDICFINLSGGIQTGFIIEFVRFDNTLVVQRADPDHEKFV